MGLFSRFKKENNKIVQDNNYYDYLKKDALKMNEEISNKAQTKEKAFDDRIPFYNELIDKNIPYTYKPQTEIERQIAYQEIYLMQRLNSTFMPENRGNLPKYNTPHIYAVNPTVDNQGNLNSVNLIILDESKGLMHMYQRIKDDMGNWHNSKVIAFSENQNETYYNFYKDTLRDLSKTNEYLLNCITNAEDTINVYGEQNLFQPIQADFQRMYDLYIENLEKNKQIKEEQERFKERENFKILNEQLIKEQNEKKQTLEQVKDNLNGNYKDDYTNKFITKDSINYDNFPKPSSTTYPNFHNLTKDILLNDNLSFYDYMNKSTEYYKQMREKSVVRKGELANSINTVDIKKFYQKIFSSANVDIEKQNSKRNLNCKAFCAALNTYRDLKIAENDINIENLKFAIDTLNNKEITIYMQVGDNIVKSTTKSNVGFTYPEIEQLDKSSNEFKLYTKYFEKNPPSFQNMDMPIVSHKRFEDENKIKQYIEDRYQKTNLSKEDIKTDLCKKYMPVVDAAGSLYYQKLDKDFSISFEEKQILNKEITKASEYYNDYKEGKINEDIISLQDETTQKDIFREATLEKIENDNKYSFEY